jgi:hypothetical protein
VARKHDSNVSFDSGGSSISDNQFATVIALMAHGQVQRRPKEYPAFKQASYLEDTKYNPALANTHLSYDDAYYKESKQFWGNGKGQKFVQGPRKIDLDINKGHIPEGKREIPCFSEEPVKVFGRSRLVGDPFAQARKYTKPKLRTVNRPQLVSNSLW